MEKPDFALRENMTPEEQLRVGIARSKAFHHAMTTFTRVNPDAEGAGAMYATEVLEVDAGNATFALLDHEKESILSLVFPDGETAAKARAQLMVALSKCSTPLTGPNAHYDDLISDGFGPVED